MTYFVRTHFLFFGSLDGNKDCLKFYKLYLAIIMTASTILLNTHHLKTAYKNHLDIQQNCQAAQPN